MSKANNRAAADTFLAVALVLLFISIHIIMDYTYNLISIHIYLLILNSNHAANIHLLFFISKHSCLKV